MRTLIILNVFLNVLVLTISAHAKDYNLKWSEVRFFLSDTTFANKDENLGALMQADQIEELKKVTGFGLEVDAEVFSSMFLAGLHWFNFQRTSKLDQTKWFINWWKLN